MPQLQSIVLTDRASPPVSHTFSPLGIDPKTGIATVSSNDSVALSRKTLSISTSTNTNVNRVKMHFFFPVTQTVTDTNGLTRTVITRFEEYKIERITSLSSTLQERENNMGMVQSALDETKSLVHDTVVNLEGIY